MYIKKQIQNFLFGSLITSITYLLIGAYLCSLATNTDLAVLIFLGVTIWLVEPWTRGPYRN